MIRVTSRSQHHRQTDHNGPRANRRHNNHRPYPPQTIQSLGQDLHPKHCGLGTHGREITHSLLIDAAAEKTRLGKTEVGTANVEDSTKRAEKEQRAPTYLQAQIRSDLSARGLSVGEAPEYRR